MLFSQSSAEWGRPGVFIGQMVQYDILSNYTANLKATAERLFQEIDQAVPGYETL